MRRRRGRHDGRERRARLVNDVVAQPGMQVLQALNVECSIHLADVIQELGVDVRTFFEQPLPGS
jgi:hypothetical protein